MKSVFLKHDSALRNLFKQYASYDKALEPLGLHGKLEEKSWIKFMTEHSVIPELASRVEVVEIFRAGRKGTKNLDGEVVDSTGHGIQINAKNKKHRMMEKYAGFGDFLIMLSAIAMKVFTGGKWDKKFPRVEDKGRLLLFWMDQGSHIFKGNGSDLMGKVVENSIRDAEDSATMTFDKEGIEEVRDERPRQLDFCYVLKTLT